MSDELVWPETVPILKEHHLIRGSLDSTDGQCHCLLGWTEAVFGTELGYHPSIESRVKEELIAVTKVVPDYEGRYPFDTAITRHNDSPKVSKATLAKEWNKAMRNLGYTENV